jgi:translation initiation factor IF-2
MQNQRPQDLNQRPGDPSQRRTDARPVDNRQPQGQQRPRPQTNQPRPAGAAGAVQQHTAGQQNQQRNDTNRGNSRPGQQGNRQRPAGQQDRRGANSQNRQQQNRNRPHSGQSIQAKAEPPKPKVVKLGTESMTVKELSAKFGREVGEIIKKLMMLGVMATINQEIDMDTAKILASEFGITVEELPPAEDPTEIPDIEDSVESLLPRPPVVTIMGHVDHGKTSLLDAIRQTNVSSQEAGGITQHIGAYQVNYQNNKIVFLDTPGHEAFTAMRARGAQVTDVAILVVAADDGVMPQTIEAINHAKAAKVPIIVAVNKIDRPGANIDRIKQQLTEQGLVTEEWGGETIVVPVSAKTKTGINELLEMILLVAEVQDLKANPNRLAIGTIIEAELDKGRGPVATVLVQKGTLRVGDTIIAGTTYGKVRAMINDRGDKVKKATPSTPVAVLGLSDVPMAGDILAVVDENTARSVAEKRVSKKRIEDMGQMQKISLDDLFTQIQEGKLKDLNIVIKADVQGSIEALRQAFAGMKNKEVRVSLVHAGVGAINESDVMLASAANALIIGFNVRPDANSRKAAESEKVDIRTYRVIYDVVNDVEAALTGMLAPEYKEVIQGRLEARKVISVPKAVVAGCYVLEGKIFNNSQLRIVRNGIVIHEGKVESLRRFKDEVKEVASGYECGVSVEKYRDIKEGDILEAFTMELVKQSS